MSEIIDEKDKSLVFDLMLKEISEKEFREKFSHPNPDSTKFIARALEEAYTETHDSDEVSAALNLGFYFEIFSKKLTKVLCNLLLEDWHYQHENIASALQEIKDPRSIECLYKGALMEFDDYRVYDEDDSKSLAVKCMYALHKINTKNSQTKLEKLKKVDNEKIRSTAKELTR